MAYRSYNDKYHRDAIRAKYQGFRGGSPIPHYVADFETTTQPNPETGLVEVWAAAIVPVENRDLEVNDVTVTNNIIDFFGHLSNIERTESNFRSISPDALVYFHNLEFDGRFILDWALRHGWEVVDKIESRELCQISVLASEMTMYHIQMVLGNGVVVEFRDSLNLVSGTVASLGKSWGTRHRKTMIDYDAHTAAYQEITEQEREYISNDVLVVAEVLQILRKSKLTTKRTIAGGAFVSMIDELVKYCDENHIYPDPESEEKTEKMAYFRALLPNQENCLRGYWREFESAHDFAQAAYRGGWCYVVPGKAGKLLHDGCTVDVNSLYPSVMLSGVNPSGEERVYPVGEPEYYGGSTSLQEVSRHSAGRYRFVRIRGHFTVKPNHLPCIQIKNARVAVGTERVVVVPLYYDRDYIYNTRVTRSRLGDEIVKNGWMPEIVVTETDLRLMLRQYDMTEVEVIDYIEYKAVSGIFDGYVNRWGDIKRRCKKDDPMRNIAKLHLNSAYGKFGTKIHNVNRVPALVDDCLKFERIESQQDSVYMPLAAAITAYARDFTITAAQANFHGADKPGFVYADTDSLHIDHNIKYVVGCTLHPSDFCCWDNEFNWTRGKFIRPKTYFEADDDKGEISVHACGLNKDLQRIVAAELTGKENPADLFREGVTIPGKLHKHIVPGGVILSDGTFTIKSGHSPLF